MIESPTLIKCIIKNQSKHNKILHNQGHSAITDMLKVDNKQNFSQDLTDWFFSGIFLIMNTYSVGSLDQRKYDKIVFTQMLKPLPY